MRHSCICTLIANSSSPNKTPVSLSLLNKKQSHFKSFACNGKQLNKTYSHASYFALYKKRHANITRILRFGFCDLERKQLSSRTRSGAPRVRKSGNLSMQEILVLTSAKRGRRVTPLPSLASAYVDPSWGRGREVPRQPGGGGKYHLFSAGNRVVPLDNQRFFLGGKSHDYRF